MQFDNLKSIEQESLARKIPIVGPLKGRWLWDKVEELKPKKVLEFGTANGYSGIILGHTGAELTTIEINDKIAEEAMKNFLEFGINAKILLGDGVEIADEIDAQFDLIFLDFAKKQYLAVLPDCLRLLRAGGILIADNITFPGCQDFKEAVLHHSQLKTEIINIKDGLSFSIKR